MCIVWVCEPHYNLWVCHLGSHEAMPTLTNADTALTAVSEPTRMSLRYKICNSTLTKVAWLATCYMLIEYFSAIQWLLTNQITVLVL